MIMRRIFVLAVACIALGKELQAQEARKLSAPTYYLAISAVRDHDNVIRVRGASNLSPGSRISLQAFEMDGDGWNAYSGKVCVTLNKNGLLSEELQLATQFRSDLQITAIFETNDCKQPANVLQVVGKHGEYLGNDRHVTMDQVEAGETAGMVRNPQLFQSSGWYFGLSEMTRIGGG